MASSKEKAIQIWNKCAKHAHANVFSFRTESFVDSTKALCFIVCDEAIKIVQEQSNSISPDSAKITFWNNVKKEIDELSKTELIRLKQKYQKNNA